MSLAAIAVVAAACLIGCGSGDERADGDMSTRDDDPHLATPEHAVTSPSGRYRLEVVPGEYSGDEGSGTYERVRVRDPDGKTVHDLDGRLSTNFATDILWDDAIDRVWVYSSDVGTYLWDRRADGTWAGRALGPKGIADGEPPVPELLVERHERVFGPAGRARARKIAERQAGSTPLPAVGDAPG